MDPFDEMLNSFRTVYQRKLESSDVRCEVLRAMMPELIRLFPTIVEDPVVPFDEKPLSEYSDREISSYWEYVHTVHPCEMVELFVLYSLDCFSKVRQTPGRVADIGSGLGHLPAFMLYAEIASSAVAVDQSKAAKMRAEMACKAMRLPLRYVLSSKERLPLRSGWYDLVTCFNVIHFGGWRETVTEMARVVRRGGGVAISWSEGYHYIPVDYDGVLDILAQAGITKVKREETERPEFTSVRIFGKKRRDNQ